MKSIAIMIMIMIVFVYYLLSHQFFCYVALLFVHAATGM